MEVTPHDLRNAELREAFRGYRPDEVEELLERAAITLERLHERYRTLQERVAQAEQDAANGREMESVLRQTLLLAQRTADETVTTAHERSRQLLEEAEDHATRMTTEAEEQARRIGESQRHKYEAIAAELAARRDALTIDIDALEKVQADYRGRLRAVLEKELEELDRRAVLPPPGRPALHEIDLGGIDDGDEVDATGEEGAEADAPGTRSIPTAPPSGGSDDAPPRHAPDGRVPASERGFGPRRPAVADPEGGPPTEALVVVDEELAENGRSGSSRRRS